MKVNFSEQWILQLEWKPVNKKVTFALTDIKNYWMTTQNYFFLLLQQAVRDFQFKRHNNITEESPL